MTYIRRTRRAGRVVEITNYFSGRYGHHEKNGPKILPTGEAAQRAYQRKQERELRGLMNANFADRVDALLTLEWRWGEAPQTSGEMKKAVQKFVRDIRPLYKARGQPLKYIYTMEVGPRGGRHIHMMLSGTKAEEIARAWPGIIHVNPLWSDGQYADIAAYFLKYSLTTEETEGRKLGRRWNASHNLEKPKDKIEIVGAKTFRQKIREKKGFYIDKAHMRSGVSEETGRPYLEYTYIRIGDRDGPDTDLPVE
ncbi:MAG: hypothetical protein WCS15_11230 [Prevotella sp.]